MDIINLKSRTRRKLLKLFFTNPDEKYYIRQIERLIEEPAGNISNELKKLNMDNLFITENVGNLLFYKLNKKYPIYNELKSIISKTIGVIGGLRKILKSVPGINCAFIFGSFARKEENNLSDIDLMIIGNPDPDNLVESINQQENFLQREINYHIYSDEEWKQRVYDRESFIQNLIEQPKIFLAGDMKCLLTEK